MATIQIAWQTGSGNITLTYQGQGDGPISVQSDANDIGSARSQVITINTTNGSPVITKNVTVSQGACPFPVGDVRNYAYTGSYQEVELPAGSYKLQCWGAQGGSNSAYSTYGITSKAGGKGGYSEGVLTLTQKTTVRVYVGGQGTSTTGGFNGGGTSSGGTTYNAGDHLGVTRMAGGGGATDIRLSDGSLYSRMIVAGGGSGGAMSYRKLVTTSTEWVSKGTVNFGNLSGSINGYSVDTTNQFISSGYPYTQIRFAQGAQIFPAGTTVKVVSSKSYASLTIMLDGGGDVILVNTTAATTNTFTFPSAPSGKCLLLQVLNTKNSGTYWNGTLTFYVEEDVTTTTEDTDSQVGYVGGGTSGGGYSNTYKGRQNAAGAGGSFGEGGPVPTTGSRYASGAGGGGWYGGGRDYGNGWSSGYCHISGGGSGFVNTSASAGNRPSGYTGLQLDSGTTYAGNTSFVAPGGGNETGHAGNGYARITRLS